MRLNEAGGSMKHRVFGIVSIAILILGILSLTHKFSEASETTIEKILSSKETYHGKEVSVSGKVSSLKQKTSKIGNPYTTFSLAGGSGGKINVYFPGHTQVSEGKSAKVTGIYRKEKRVGEYIFKNEIEATDIKNE